MVTPTRYASIAYSHPRWWSTSSRSAGRWSSSRRCWLPTTRRPASRWSLPPCRATRAELPGEPTPYSPFGTILAGRPSVRCPRWPRAVRACRTRAPAGGARRGPRRGRGATSARPVRRSRRQGCAPGGAGGQGGARSSWRTSARATAAGLVRRALRAPTGSPGSWPGTAPCRRTVPPASTGCWSTPLHRARRVAPPPEARWRRRADDLLGLVLLQRRLVSAAVDLVRPGGVVLYATCSPVPSETRGWSDRCWRVATTCGSRTRRRCLPEVPDCAGPVPGTLQLWPHRHGTDAMFLACCATG